jgi:hypothetical protein
MTHTLLIPALRRLNQEDSGFHTSLGYIDKQNKTRSKNKIQSKIIPQFIFAT